MHAFSSRHRLPNGQRQTGVSASLRFQAVMISPATRAKIKLLVETSNPPTEGRRSLSSVSFGFMTRQVERHVAGGLTDRSVIVFAPMFAEYCGCRTSSIGTIYPTR